MRNKILISLLMLSLFIGGVVTASSFNGDYKGMPIVKVRVNGTEVHPEVAAHIEGDGTTLLPLRVVTEALGATVTWHGDSYSVDVDKRELSLSQLNKIGESVGLVYALDASGKAVSQGSGFLLANGVFVTCDHVASKGTSLQITLNGKIYTANQFLFRNSTSDLAAVKIEATGGLEYTTQLPKFGDMVYSLGFPHGKFQVFDGTYQVLNYNNLIVHTARTDNGNSGGILISLDGKVIGVTSEGIDDTHNGAIPMKFIQQELDKLH